MSEPIEVDMGELLQSFDPPEQPTAMRLEIGTAPAGVSEALVSSMASLANRLEAAEARQEQIVTVMERLISMMDSDRDTLVAALGEMAEALRSQPAPVVHVDAPVFPDPQITVMPPEVNITMPESQVSRKITVQRDPLTGLIASADVVEG